MNALSLPLHSDGINLKLAELLQYKNYISRFAPPAMSIWSQLNGQHKSRKLGRGMDFTEVRPYQMGDDVRSIDWRVSARTGKTHTKLYTEEREQPIMLIVDLSMSMRFGSELLLKSVQACHFAALLSWLACSQKDRIGAVIFGENFLYECKPTSRRQGTLHVLGTLIKAHQDMHKMHTKSENNNLHIALEHMHRLCPKGSDITLISDFYSLKQQDKKKLTELRRHNRLQFVQLYDSLEKGKTSFRGIELIADDQQSAWLNFGAKATRNSLKLAFNAHQNFIKEMALSLNIPLHTVNANKPLLAQLNKFT